MSEVFEGYERRYGELSVNLSRKTSSFSLVDEEEKKQIISEMITGLEEAEDLIRKMDVEARSLQPNVKAVLLAKLRENKSDLNNLKHQVKGIASTNLDQEELLESGMAASLIALENQGDRSVTFTSNEPLSNHSSTESGESGNAMLEKEELCLPLLQDLHHQQHTDNTLHMSKSKRLIGSLSRKIGRNKWRMGAITALLALAIALILYLRFSK